MQNLAVFLAVQCLGISSSCATQGFFELNSITITSRPEIGLFPWGYKRLLLLFVPASMAQVIIMPVQVWASSDLGEKQNKRNLYCKSLLKLIFSPSEAVISSCTWRFLYEVARIQNKTDWECCWSCWDEHRTLEVTDFECDSLRLQKWVIFYPELLCRLCLRILPAIQGCLISVSVHHLCHPGVGRWSYSQIVTRKWTTAGHK